MKETLTTTAKEEQRRQLTCKQLNQTTHREQNYIEKCRQSKKRRLMIDNSSGISRLFDTTHTKMGGGI